LRGKNVKLLQLIQGYSSSNRNI